jgi:serine protease AprX
VGVAVIDSGVANLPQLANRVLLRKDFTGTRRTAPTSSATARTSRASSPRRAGSDDTTGLAPGRLIISLKVLDAKGNGKASAAIQAIDFAIAHKDKFNIKVINLSLGAMVLQSYKDDPLCQAWSARTTPASWWLQPRAIMGSWLTARACAGLIDSPGNSPVRHHRGRAEHQGHGRSAATT